MSKMKFWCKNLTGNLISLSLAFMNNTILFPTNMFTSLCATIKMTAILKKDHTWQS